MMFVIRCDQYFSSHEIYESIRPELVLYITEGKVISEVDYEYICRPLVAPPKANMEFYGIYFILANKNIIKITDRLSESYGYDRNHCMVKDLAKHRDILLGSPSFRFAMSIIKL